MSRALIVINSEFDRKRAAHWASKAPRGMRIEYKTAKRSLDQNAKMWACLTDVYDRDFQAGDTVYLEFYDPETQPPPYPTHSIQKLISYVLHGGQFGIEQGYVVLGLNDPKEQS